MQNKLNGANSDSKVADSKELPREIVNIMDGINVITVSLSLGGTLLFSLLTSKIAIFQIGMTNFSFLIVNLLVFIMYGSVVFMIKATDASLLRLEKELETKSQIFLIKYIANHKLTNREKWAAMKVMSLYDKAYQYRCTHVRHEFLIAIKNGTLPLKEHLSNERKYQTR